jgi:hypothetical protein
VAGDYFERNESAIGLFNLRDAEIFVRRDTWIVARIGVNFRGFTS